MYNYVLKNCTIILRKSGVTLLSSFNKSAKSPVSIEIKQQKTCYIQRNFCSSACYTAKTSIQIKKELDGAEKLNELLKDSQINKMYKLLQYELEYMKYSNYGVPSKIKPKDWIHLLDLPSTSQRRKYIRFLFLNEMKDINQKKKHQEEKEQNSQALKEIFAKCPSGLEYGLGKNNMFLRIYDKTMDYYFNYKMILSILYEPTVVIDCGFDREMSHAEIKNCAKQIAISFSRSRLHKYPAPIYLCNASTTNKLIKSLYDMIPTLYEDQCPLQITSQSYLDLFDKDKLVYLTPHCREEMQSYDPDKIYIIGALVDKKNPQPFTLAKAKRENIKMEKLPLDTHFLWNTGSTKSLTINQVFGILLDIKLTQDWSIALGNNIPSRKVKRLVEKDEITKKYNIKNINK